MTNQLDTATMRARYESGVLAHNRQKQQRAGETRALMLAVEIFDNTVQDRRIAKLAHLAKLFCIASVFVLPNLLIISYAF